MNEVTGMKKKLKVLLAVILMLCVLGVAGVLARDGIAEFFTPETTAAHSDNTGPRPTFVWSTAPYSPDSLTRADELAGFAGFVGVWSRIGADGQMLYGSLDDVEMRTELALYPPDVQTVRVNLTNHGGKPLEWGGEPILVDAAEMSDPELLSYTVYKGSEFVVEYWDGSAWQYCPPKDRNLIYQYQECALADGLTTVEAPVSNYVLPGDGYYRIGLSVMERIPQGGDFRLYSIFEVASDDTLTLTEERAAELIREPPWAANS